MSERIAALHAGVKPIDTRPRWARAFVIHRVAAEIPKCEGPSAHPRVGWGAAVKQRRVEEHHVSGFDREGDDVMVLAVALDVGQAWQASMGMQWRGVVAELEA